MQNRYTLLFFLLAFATTLSAQQSFYPVAICHGEINVALPDQCLVAITPDMVDAGSYTALGTLSLSVSPSMLVQGINIVTLTADNGIFPTRSCTSRVLVEDTTPPVVSCRNPVNFIINDPTLLPDYLEVSDVAGEISDNCFIPETYVFVVGLNYFGSTAYQLEVRDQSGNESKCKGMVNVRSPHYSGEVCHSYGNTRFEYIQSVGLSSPTNNRTYNSGDNDGQVLFGRFENRLRARDALTLTYAPGFNFGSYREYWRVYLDMNRDGDWTDAGETIHEWNGFGGNTATINLPIFFGRNGISRLRVVMSYEGYKGPCATSFYGETEDYAVRLLPWWSFADDGGEELADKSKDGKPTDDFIIEVPLNQRAAPPARSAVIEEFMEENAVQVFPNPAVAGNTVRIDLGARPQVQRLLLRSMTGSVIADRSVAKGGTISDFPLPANLKAGIYLLSGNGADGVAVWSRRVLVK